MLGRQPPTPVAILDYLYLGQLPPLLFASLVWQAVRARLAEGQDAKHRLQTAVSVIAGVRNEIAHAREVAQDRLLRATVACNDVTDMLPTNARG